MVNKMEENKEFLLILYEVCSMGKESTNKLLDVIHSKDNKIKPLLISEIQEYEDYLQKTIKYMNQYDLNEKSSNLLSKLSTSIGINMEMLNDNSDAKIADVMIQGYTMGILKITKKLKQYDNLIESDLVSMAKKINKMQSKNIEKLKKYL